MLIVRCLALSLALLIAPTAASHADDETDAHDFTLTGIDGEPLPLERYRGKPLLVVNTASLCGFTYQYEGLQALYERFREDGLVVLGVPSNDFGGQEPGSAQEIKEFCEVNFAIDFPLAQKEHVRGRASHPLFAWFRRELGQSAGPRWNFHKYLITPDGEVTEAWSSAVEPLSPPVLRAIEDQLAAAAALDAGAPTAG